MHLRQQVAQPTDTSYRYIVLTQNQIAIVDAEDFEWLDQWAWSASLSRRTGKWYAVRAEKIGGKSVRVYMHRQVMHSRPGEYTDHKESTLDNRKSNLRKCTNSQNMAHVGKLRNNKSGYRGVSWDKERHLWRATIACNRKYILLGRFGTAEAAARAYDVAAKRLFGEFAFSNRPDLRSEEQS